MWGEPFVQPGIQRPDPRTDDEQEKRAQRHGEIGAGFVGHLPETGLEEVCRWDS
jgi:hypothetical protein